MVNIKERLRFYRKNPTKTENIIWQNLRNRKLKGKKFIRQYPIFFEYIDKKRLFIADFYCAASKLVIEIDGKIHQQQQDYDNLRTAIIKNKNIKVIRFTNEQVEKNLEDVLREIIRNL